MYRVADILINGVFVSVVRLRRGFTAHGCGQKSTANKPLIYAVAEDHMWEITVPVCIVLFKAASNIR